MDHFLYRDGRLMVEEVELDHIADCVGTPFYCYSAATLTRHFQLFAQALDGMDHLVCYAMKSCSNLAVLKLLGDLGAGMDVVSVGEYARARAAGIPADRIVFSGVGKTRAEMAETLRAGIRQFNVESEPELEALSEVAAGLGLTAPVALRVNPDVDAGTHEKIATGRRQDKFGVPIDRAEALYARAGALPGLAVVGIDVHIGSQLTSLAPFEEAYGKVAALTRRLRQQGHEIGRLDLGGGLGIPYTRGNDAPPLPSDYGALIRRTVGDLGCEIEIEPGRLISGNAGVLVAEILYLKEEAERSWLIVDAGMNDLIRPAMYGAHHDIVPLVEPEAGVETRDADVVGPVCETGDTFARARALPPLAAGDRVAFRSAGAYGAVMASEYNSRPLVPEVLVRGDHFAVIRPRPSIDEMLARDRVPEWL